MMVISALLLSLSYTIQTAQAGGGHDLPPSSIGDRQAAIDGFSYTIYDDRMDLSYSFIDKATGKNIEHVTYVMAIVNPDGKTVFSEVLHGHDGKMKLQFNSNSEQYRVNANYDNLAASYVPDYAGLITVDGPVIDAKGDYKVLLEVNGVDFDNTFLEEPLKYEFNVSNAEPQKFHLSYEDRTFDVGVQSPSPASEVVFMQADKKLVINYPSDQAMHFDNFRVVVTIPKEMMSGPFAATYNGMDLMVQETEIGDLTALILTGEHLDVMQDMQMLGEKMNNSLTIIATTVVPEFPLGISVVAAASLVSAIILIARVKRSSIIS